MGKLCSAILFVGLYMITNVHAYPVFPVLGNIDAVNNHPRYLEDDSTNPQNQTNVVKDPKQGQQNQRPPSTAAQTTSFIGNNVANVVASSLTGNFGGIFSSSLNLLNTNNRVNQLFGGFGGSTLPAPIANGNNLIFTHSTTVATTAAAATSAASTSTEDEDNEDEY